MKNNGSDKRKNIWHEVADQVSDHIDLAALEMRFEAKQAGRKLLVGAVVFVLLLTAFIVAQVAAIAALMRAGLTLSVSALVLSATYLVMGGLVYLLFGRRDPRVGPPFAGTQREMRETLQWIRNIFS